MGSRLLYMLPALVLALLALVLAIAGLNRSPSTALTVETTQRSSPATETPAYRYWVVTEALDVGDRLNDDNLAVVSSPAPINNVLSADEKVDGKALRQFARPGELLSRNHLEPGGTLPASLPAGYRAVAVAVNDVVMAGGLLRPGDRVDVAAAFRKSANGSPAATLLMRNIQVLAVQGTLAEQTDNTRTRQRNDTVVLAVPVERVPALLLAEEEGALRLAVIASDDSNTPTQARPSASISVRELLPGATPTAKPTQRGQRVEVFEGSESRSTYVR